MELQTSNNNKSTSVISWIGFGLASTVFILIWVVNIIVFQLRGEVQTLLEDYICYLFQLGEYLESWH